MGVIQRTCLTLLFSLGIFLWSGVHYAASAQVVINEILINPPSTTDAEEWIELYNNSDNAINLNNWKIQDKLGSVKTYILPDSLLQPHQYYLVDKTTENVTPKIDLNNGGDGLILRNMDDALVDQMDYSGEVGSVVNKSYGRYPDGNSEWVFIDPPTAGSTNLMPAPSSPTPTPTPTVTGVPVLVDISEVMACPETGQNEWVELFNRSGTTITLESWHVVDSGGEKRVVEGVMEPGEYGVFEWGSGLLNNTGDTLTLQRNDDSVADTMSYPGCTKGTSWIKDGGTWKETLTVTKNAGNTFSPSPAPTAKPTEIPSTPIPSSPPAPTVTPKPPTATAGVTRVATVAGIMDVTHLTTESGSLASAGAMMAATSRPTNTPYFFIGGGLLTAAGVVWLVQLHHD